jgi:hypothetical protein
MQLRSVLKHFLRSLKNFMNWFLVLVFFKLEFVEINLFG